MISYYFIHSICIFFFSRNKKKIITNQILLPPPDFQSFATALESKPSVIFLFINELQINCRLSSSNFLLLQPVRQAGLMRATLPASGTRSSWATWEGSTGRGSAPTQWTWRLRRFLESSRSTPGTPSARKHFPFTVDFPPLLMNTRHV